MIRPSFCTPNYNQEGQLISISTSLKGKSLLDYAKLNKGCAFTQQERIDFHLQGLIPDCIETLDQQKSRCHQKYLSYQNPINRHIYLRNLYEYNETLFYALVTEHLESMLPIIYTPTVGEAVRFFSQEFAQSYGLYFTANNYNNCQQIIDQSCRQGIKLVIITDGEGVLGIGDQGIGGMSIASAKLMVYTLCGGIHPNVMLPIMLDVGTNNPALLNDPLYLGLRSPRLIDQPYDDFIHTFVTQMQSNFPNIYFHWEDFGYGNAGRILEQYRHQTCSFNDDIQGTGAVALATILAASQANDQQLEDHRIVVFGAGSAGMGIVSQIADTMERQGIESPRDRIYLVDKPGLLTTHTKALNNFQKPYAKSPSTLIDWKRDEQGRIPLEEVILQVKPTILIGCSTKGGAFTKAIITTMHQYCPHPIIMPLSNPTSCAEAHPADIFNWTQGKAHIATGSPFDTVSYENKTYAIAQCNNAYIFPGLGLGAMVAQASQVTDNMIDAACMALAECAPKDAKGHVTGLLPKIRDIHTISKHIAKRVAQTAIHEGIGQSPKGVNDNIDLAIQKLSWHPNYVPLVPA